MSTILFKKEERNEAGKLIDYRNVTCSFNADGGFSLGCCDINSTAASHFGDSGVEFYITLKPPAVDQLCPLLNVGPKNAQGGLIAAVQKKFTGEKCFTEFRNFCDANSVPYEFDRW